MANILTDQQLSELCAAMRGLEFLDKNRAEADTIPGMKAEENKMRDAVKIIWDQLDEEEQNKVLAEHKRQWAIIERKASKKNKK